ncbi:MAG: aspartate/glutamate racemase family protein [Acidaminococcaceae bacterium]
MKNGFVKTGKSLGVIGGMGPAASAEFLHILTKKSPAEIDQEHAVVYMIADTELPDRSSAILGKGEDPSEQLKKDFSKLAALGADVFAVPCNTAHYFIDRFEKPLPKPLVHIVKETLMAAQRLNPEGAWMLSTVGTMQSGLYQSYADKLGYNIYIPNEMQVKEIQKSILAVKANEFVQAGEIVKNVVVELWREKDLPVMTACTEIPLGYNASGLPQEKAVSSLEALADACIAELYVKK